MLVKAERLKTQAPISSMLFGSVIPFKLHAENAQSWMLLTLLWIVMLSNAVQPEKVAALMLITLLGIVKLSNEVQHLKALLSMLVTESGKSTYIYRGMGIL